MKLLFEKLAEELENTTFKCEDYIVEGAGFSNLPISVYSLEVIYNQNKIIIENELGNHNFGKVEMVLKDKNLPEFEITNVNHFVNLFLRVLTPIKQEYYSKFRLLIMRLIFLLKLDAYPGSISRLV